MSSAGFYTSRRRSSNSRSRSRSPNRDDIISQRHSRRDRERYTAQSQISSSSKRDSGRQSRRYTRSQIDRDTPPMEMSEMMEIVTKESEVQKNDRNTSILETPFTFGMEWEPTSLCIYYSPFELKKHYDRETIFTSHTTHLNVTIESRKMKDSYPEVLPYQEERSCKYNLEFAIGILGKNPPVLLNSFLQNSQYFIPEIKEELNDFKENFFEKEKTKGFFKKVWNNKTSKFVGDNFFIDCKTTEPLTPENTSISPYFYMKADDDKIDDINGRPQITLGMSYALFPPLLKALNEVNYNYSKELYNFTGPYVFSDIDNKLVCEGFALLLLYYSFVASTYYSNKLNHPYPNAAPYFKAAFDLKPRSNLAESYKHLKAEYTDFEEFITLFDQKIRRLFEELWGESFDPATIHSYNSLVELHLNVVRKVAPDLIGRIEQKQEEYQNNTYVYEDIIGFLTTTGYNDEKLNKIINIVAFINTIYLIYKILHPQKVVKLKINRKKIKNDHKCKFLDGYYYSYQGESKTLVDELVRKKIAEIINNTVYDFSHTSDPQILEVEREEITSKIKSICPSDREETFEYIPENSNLIVEVRGPEKFLDDVGSSFKFSSILDCSSKIFTKINTIFTSFLKDQKYDLSSSYFSKMLPTFGSCSVMFRPKAKSKTRKSNTRKSKTRKSKTRKSKKSKTKK